MIISGADKQGPSTTWDRNAKSNYKQSTYPPTIDISRYGQGILVSRRSESEFTPYNFGDDPIRV